MCERQFLVVMVGFLDVKSLVEDNGEGYKSRKCTVLEIFVYVMYYVYVTSGPSLLIESTDSMIKAYM